MFVDELTITAKAGHGGNGVERWRHERRRPLGGPAGGNGGNGGDVYIRGVRNLNQLAKYTGSKMFAAENGEHGKNRSQYGRNGEDYIIDIPVGAVVTDSEREKVYEVESEGQMLKILSGGRGGLGNEHFKSSTNTTPKETTDGTPGEEGTFYIELRLAAHVGLIGFPNAGKSSLLNALTNATSAVGAHPFTTLEPHLGECYGLIIADIPGLIEGASEGKGLGHKFLRHVSRTRMLFHLISLENEDVTLAYKTLRNELESSDGALTEKEEWVILTKSDMVDGAEADKWKEHFKEMGKNVYVISVLDDESLKSLREALLRELSPGGGA